MSTNRVAEFRRLHEGPSVLVLANCWDAGSARLVESLGARALATTSAGVAWSCGHPDGDALPTERLADAVRAIVRTVALPLSVDVEGGYASDPAAVGETVAALVEAGVVGINLEDGREPPEALAAKIESVKRAVRKRGADVFINARTDVYLAALVPEAKRLEETLSRARLFEAAGADGLFVPKVVEPAEIRAITAGTKLPLNVLAWPKLPPAAELAALGVRRLSAGSAIALQAFARAAASTKAFLREGRSDDVAGAGLSYAEMNALFQRA
jgi:2-methylisocitrate lyase-like PEP mutase family enzyme